MIVADASALVSVMIEEDDAPTFRAALVAADGVLVSAVNAWEAAVRVERDWPGDGPDSVDGLLDAIGGEVVRITDADWRRAVDVWRRWGRPNHPAELNLGDCFAYALAESRGLPLLYKGKDFPQTDVRSVL